MSTKENDTVNEQNEENATENGADLNGSDEKDRQLSEMKAKVDELNDKYLRLYSEYDNFRKRTAKEKGELIQAAGEDVFKGLLPILDDFERAIKSSKDTTDVNAIQEGVQLIFNKLRNTLQQKGLTEMKSVGETFDADVHEAITNVPAPSEDQKGKVIEELEKGYMLNGKIIRFAKVVIGQ